MTANWSNPRVLAVSFLNMAMRVLADRLFFTIILLLVYYTNCLNAENTVFVTYNSVIKLLNIDYNVRLHSHDIKYGRGSGQQSVTGTETMEDKNSYWMVKGPTAETFKRGTPVKCDDTIRLEHTETKKNLHSHLVMSPLSGKQEVSAYGDGDGEGDTGDHWTVVCNSHLWKTSEPVSFNHVDTKAFLFVSGRTYGAPINGQVEVVGDYSKVNRGSQWKVAESIIIHPVDAKPQDRHDEL